MRRNAYWQEPKKARCAEGEAWWYANKGRIEVHVQAPGAPHITVTVSRRQLAEYIKRSSGDKHEQG